MAEPGRQGTGTPPPSGPGTAGDVMRPVLTACEPGDHVAAAAYLMRHAGTTSLVVMEDEQIRRPVGIITEADIVGAVAAGKDLADVRIAVLMSRDPVVIRTTASVREAAGTMVRRRFRHLPVVGDDGCLRGMVDILDVCAALLGSSSPEGEGTSARQKPGPPPGKVD